MCLTKKYVQLEVMNFFLFKNDIAPSFVLVSLMVEFCENPWKMFNNFSYFLLLCLLELIVNVFFFILLKTEPVNFPYISVDISSNSTFCEPKSKRSFSYQARTNRTYEFLMRPNTAHRHFPWEFYVNSPQFRWHMTLNATKLKRKCSWVNGMKN